MRTVSVIEPLKHLLIIDVSEQRVHRTTIECGDLAGAIKNGAEQEARAAWSAGDIDRFTADDKSAQWDEGSQKWLTVADYRGQYWTADGGLVEITEPGVSPPAGAAELTAGQALIQEGETWRLRTDADDLVEARQSKIAELKAAVEKAINSGFESAALGTKHQYDSEQHNIDWIQVAVLSGTKTRITCDDGRGAATSKTPREHTAPECKQVLTDGKTALLARKTRFRTLRDQVTAAANVGAVKAIKW